MSSVLLVNQKHGGSPVYFDSWTIDSYERVVLFSESKQFDQCSPISE